MEFPRLVYKSAESHAVANDDDEHAALLAAGWHASVPEAIEARNAPRVMPAPPVAPMAPVTVETKEYSDGTSATGTPPLPDLSPDQQDAADDAAPTRAELEQKARELGVSFSHFLGDAKLAQRINEAIAAKA